MADSKDIKKVEKVVSATMIPNSHPRKPSMSNRVFMLEAGIADHAKWIQTLLQELNAQKQLNTSLLQHLQQLSYRIQQREDNQRELARWIEEHKGAQAVWDTTPAPSLGQ